MSDKIPNEIDSETQVFADEVFAPPEGEDLKCYALDEDGSPIDMGVEQVLIVIE